MLQLALCIYTYCLNCNKIFFVKGAIMNKSALAKILLISCLLCTPAFADFKEHFDLAQTYLGQYQYSGAISEFKSALRINYMDTSARIGLVNAYLARGTNYANSDKDWEKAADDYRNALFYLRYYPTSKDAINNSAQAIMQVVSNLSRCLSEMGFERTPQNSFQTAQRLQAEGNFGAAAYEYTQALGDKSLQKDSFEQIGNIMNTLGNKPKAVEYYKKAVAVAPSDLDLRLTYAKALDETNEPKQALKEYSYILGKATSDNKEALHTLEHAFISKMNEDPKNANLNANLAAVLQKEGRFDEALSYYKQAEALDPSNINTRINVGTLYQQKGDYRTAIKAYESVLILYPDNVNANLYRAQCYEKLGDDKIAHEGYKKVLSIDPENSVIKSQMIETVKKAMPVQQFVDYIKTNYSQSNPGDIIYDYAIELHKAKKTEDAIYLYKEALKLIPEKNQAQVYVNLALAMAQNKEYDEAVTTLKSAHEKFPVDKEISKNLKNIAEMKLNSLMDNAAQLYTEKKYKEAAAVYLSIIPQNVNSMIGAASCFQELGETDKAIEYYKKALELKPLDSDIAYYIAALYGEKEDYANAKEYLGKSIAFNKNNKQAVEYLHSIEEMDRGNMLNDAISKYEAQKYDESLQDLNTLLSKDDKNAYALYYRGMIYDTKEKRKEAIKDFEKAYSLNKEFKICPYMIASNYDALNNTKEAVKYYEMYANSDVEDDDYKKYAEARAQELKESAANTSASK